MKINGYTKLLIVTLLILLWLLPSVVLFQRRLVDPFLWTPLSTVANAQIVGSLQGLSEDQPLYSILLYALSSIGGITPEQLSILPVGALITPMIYFMVARRLLRSNLLAAIIATYSAYDFSLYAGHYNSMAYAWLRPLFLTFVFLFVEYVAGKRNFRTPRNRAFLLVPLLIVFLAVYYFHPTYIVWILALTGGTALIVRVTKKLNVRKLTVKGAGFVTLSLFVIYFGFNQLLFSTLIRRAVIIEPVDVWDQLGLLVANFLGLEAISAEKYSLVLAPPTLMIGYAAFARTLTILLGIIMVAIVWLVKKRAISQPISHVDSILIVAFLGIGITHSIGYALLGRVSMRFVVLAFPLVVLLGMRMLGFQKVALVFIGILVAFAVAQTGSYALDVDYDATALDEITSVSAWLTTFGSLHPSVLSDFESSQAIRFRFAQEGRSINQQFYDTRLYTAMISGNDPVTSADYIVINLQRPSTQFSGWVIYEPLSLHSEKLDANPFLTRVYDGGGIWISHP